MNNEEKKKLNTPDMETEWTRDEQTTHTSF